MPCSWEGNRRSGLTLAMRHRLQWFIQLVRPKEGRWAPRLHSSWGKWCILPCNHWGYIDAKNVDISRQFRVYLWQQQVRWHDNKSYIRLKLGHSGSMSDYRTVMEASGGVITRSTDRNHQATTTTKTMLPSVYMGWKWRSFVPCLCQLVFTAISINQSINSSWQT